MIINIGKNLLWSFKFLRNFREKFSKKRMEMLTDLEYPIYVATKMIMRYSDTMDLSDKVVLEIGPGNCFVNALVYLLYGAKKVYLIDKYKFFFMDKKNAEYCSNILNRIRNLNGPFYNRVLNAISISGRSVSFNKCMIEFRYGDASRLPMDSNIVDVIFTNAVLEHIPNLKSAIYENKRVLKQNGVAIHEVDLRDHFDVKNPLKMLEYSNGAWFFMTFNRPGYTNRYRLSDYLAFFKEAGLLVEQYSVIQQYEGELNKLKLNRKFYKYDYNEIKILVFLIKVKKINS